MFEISVIICSHNPRPDYLDLTLRALREQTFETARWELLLVDNACSEPLSKRFDLSWHPHGRHVREHKLGVSHARVAGIKQSTGQLILFVDDDNLLAPDYLEQALRIGSEWPMLGAWGGQSEGRFESPPPDWTVPHLEMVAVRKLSGDHWSNSYDHGMAHPFGAGSVLRRRVADAYVERAGSDPLRLELGRRGVLLTCCEDTDYVLTALDVGMGTGVFEKLRLTHLIPSRRLTEPYLLELAEKGAFSAIILQNFRPQTRRIHTIKRHIYEWLRLCLAEKHSRRIGWARLRGIRKALAVLRNRHPVEARQIK